jgi:nitrite reductase/ring-hydroxylating ferredoxin subunit
MRITISVFVLFLMLFSCKKRETTEQVPYVPVNFTIYTTDPLYSALQVNGGHIYYSAGSRGVIVYRKSTDEFKAYDQHCPYNVSDACGKVIIDNSGITAVDSCCGSSFSLIDGTVVKGPATTPLRQYTALLEGSKIRVYN